MESCEFGGDGSGLMPQKLVTEQTLVEVNQPGLFPPASV